MAERNKVLSITMQVRDKMTPALKAVRIGLATLKRVGTATLRGLAGAARLAGRAFKAMLGPLGLVTTALSGFGIAKVLKAAASAELKVREIGSLLGRQPLTVILRH